MGMLRLSGLTLGTGGSGASGSRVIGPLSLALGLWFVVAGCDCGNGGRGGNHPTPPGMDAGPTTMPGTDGGVVGAFDVRPNPDAFWADDPPAMVCLEDGTMGPPPEPPGGTPECPSDKNREGCPCSPVGATMPCWPGLRANRGRGSCSDGVATCESFTEFIGVWSACEGFILPTPGATTGPGTCRCFSGGRWAIDNLSPCFVDYGESIYAVSTFIDGAGQAQCPTDVAPSPPPSPQPGTNWSTNRLTVDCTGRFSLCYTLKAGDADAPTAADCTVAQTCTDPVWYREANVEQELPPLPAWASATPAEAACAAQFQDSGGYGEMAVRGLSAECDVIDDGADGYYVFSRVNYCPSRCNETPTLPECEGCMQGGSGMF